MVFDDVLKLTNDTEKSVSILEVARTVRDYHRFRSLKELGLEISYSDLPFETLMVFTWIKEAYSGRKN